ncbi:MAG: formyltransferase family protein [SAR86 cluster bacterium]|nr:formyltransferase family protein [SAR86 cluster bacterium]
MKEVSLPPKIIPILSSNERSKISQSIIKNEDIGLAWLEKIRKFISFHNRNLKNISIKRFGNDSLPHLIWMKEIINNQIFNSDENLIDVGLLNAALIIADACPVNIIEKNQLDIILKNHQNHLIHTTPVVPKNLSTIQQFQYSFDGWKARDHKKIPVTIFCPSPYSLFSIAVLKILLSLNIEVKAVVILKFSSSRIRSELYRDGLPLFIKRVWRKLILKADENNIETDLSLVNLKNSIEPSISDIRKLAAQNNIQCLMVNAFNESIELEKNAKGDLCIFTGGGLISKQVLDYFSEGIINIHMGPLPQYKGMDVVEAPILDGAFNNIALTAHIMESELDAGPLIAEMKFITDEYESLSELRNEMGAMMPIIAVESILSVLSYDGNLIKQEPTGQQYYFIHPRLREIISKVMSLRFESFKLSNTNNRQNQLKSFELLISALKN